MAYVFFILENGILANGKPLPINDNYTYRLMELEATDNDPALNRHKYSPSSDLEAQLIIPRVPSEHSPSHNDNEDYDEDKPSKRKKPIKIPKDLEEEISRFQIPISPPERQVRKKKVKKSVKPKRSPKRSKSKGKPKDEYDIMMDDIDNDDHHEEEEETEEKKEKIHKLTIKKKRPLKNITDDSSTMQPYRTILETAQSGSPHRFQPPFARITRQRVRPLVLKENIHHLDPALQPVEQISTPTKTVKPRDVSLILRTKHRNPRILIRRYKPYVNTLTYPFLGQRPPPQPPARKKKRHRHRKRRKKIRHPSKFSSFHTGHQDSSCSNDHPLTQPIDTFSPHTDPYSSIYPLHSGDFSYEPSKFSNFDVVEPTKDYVSPPYDRYVFPSESPSFSPEIPLDSLENSDLPSTYEEKAEGLTADEPMSIGYDVHEHENTAELAANHKKETDDSLEEDHEPLQYDDVEADDGNRGSSADVEYENEAEESLRLVSLFGKTTRASKPIKKADFVNLL